MTAPDDGRLPAPIPRAALERILARAAELQLGGGDVPESFTEAQLMELGKEVGIPAQHVRQALAEERTRIVLPEEAGIGARVAGPARVEVSRVVRGTPAAILGALDAWMQREECLQPRRRGPDRLTWEARRDFAGQLRRGMRLGGRGYDLAPAHEVGATATAMDAERTLVRLDADLDPARRARLTGGGAATATGMAGAGAWSAIAHLFLVPAAAATLGPIGAVVLVGAGAAAGYGIARGHRGIAARAQLALEQALDQLEHHLPSARRPPSLLDMVADVARRIR